MSEHSSPSKSASTPKAGLSSRCQRVPGKHVGSKWFYPFRDAGQASAQPAGQVAPAEQPNAPTAPTEVTANDNAHL